MALKVPTTVPAGKFSFTVALLNVMSVGAQLWSVTVVLPATVKGIDCASGQSTSMLLVPSIANSVVPVVASDLSVILIRLPEPLFGTGLPSVPCCAIPKRSRPVGSAGTSFVFVGSYSSVIPGAVNKPALTTSVTCTLVRS